MSSLQYRSSIVLGALLVALLLVRPAEAQVGIQGGPRPPDSLASRLVTGVEYDIVNQEKAERRLQQVQEKLRRDAQRCDSAATERDVRRIENLKYRIVVDEWLIRQNSLIDPGCYPHSLRPDPITCAAIANASRPVPNAYPSQFYPPPFYPSQSYPSQPYSSQPYSPTTSMAVAPKIAITITNTQAAGNSVAFTIDGVSYEIAPDSRRELSVPLDSKITYDVGGLLGQRRYLITPGVFEFRSTPEGLALYKLPDKP